jgi:tetratricopeptide (TPR) repeat protein
MNHAFLGSTIHHCQGTWDKIEDLDENLLKDSLKFGDLYQPSLFLWFYGLVKSEQGKFSQLTKAIELLYEIGEIYDYSQAISNALSLKADYFIKLRKSQEAVEESEKGVSYSQEKDIEVYELMFLGFKAEAQQQTGDMQGARDSILQASRVYETQPLVVMPLFVAPYTTACLSLSIIELKKAILSKTSSDITHSKKRVESFRNLAIKKLRKYAPYRTKNYRLIGNYYWLMGKQGKALKWWARSIKEGVKLGARLDLSRSYFEIGKRLLDPKSKYRKLNGINAKGYMEKAGVLFKEMDLKKDLEEMQKILPV